MSVSLVNLPFGECSLVYPSGKRSFASRSNQTLEPYLANNSATWLIVSSSMIGVPSSA